MYIYMIYIITIYILYNIHIYDIYIICHITIYHPSQAFFFGPKNICTQVVASSRFSQFLFAGPASNSSLIKLLV